MAESLTLKGLFSFAAVNVVASGGEFDVVSLCFALLHIDISFLSVLHSQSTVLDVVRKRGYF